MATLYYRPYSSEPIKDNELPSHDALENILPEYKYIFLDPESSDPRDHPPGDNVPELSTSNKPPPAAPKPAVQPTPRGGEDLDRTTMGLLDYQMRELEKYRLAVQTMGNDIVQLRHQIQTLEAENSKLRLELGHYNDATRLLLDSQELDGLTKPELAARYVSIKQKLNSQTSDLRTYKERVVELQNDLIKKNDKERDYVRLNHAHTSQQELVQRLQDKVTRVKRLEDACRKQEKVIEKMERMINTNSSQGRSNQANEVLLDENRRLRQELEAVKEAQTDMYNQRDDKQQEKLDLYQRLDKAENRIQSLEKQLSENARQWAREKSDLHLKLREAEHGLQRNLSPGYRTYPKIAARPSPEVPPADTRGRHYSKAPPGASRKTKPFHGAPKILDPLRYEYR